jgi:hypothetical protein
LTLSAKARNGYISRAEALKIYNSPIQIDPDLVEYVKKRLGLSDTEYNDIMSGPIRTWRDFRTYKKRFEILRPLFYVLAKAELVPVSFYMKYCFPIK